MCVLVLRPVRTEFVLLGKQCKGMYNGSLRGGGDGKPYFLSGTSGTGVVDDWSSGVKYGAPSA